MLPYFKFLLIFTAKDYILRHRILEQLVAKYKYSNKDLPEQEIAIQSSELEYMFNVSQLRIREVAAKMIITDDVFLSLHFTS